MNSPHMFCSHNLAYAKQLENVCDLDIIMFRQAHCCYPCNILRFEPFGVVLFCFAETSFRLWEAKVTSIPVT